MKSVFCYKNTTLPFCVKDLDNKKGIITGYFSAFNNLDSDGDVILPKAFAKSISENGPGSAHPRIKHLLNHRHDQPIGKILVLREDSKGLYYESQIGSHALGKEFLEMVQSGLISEHSIGYSIINAERGTDGLNYLRELRLWEGSSLTFLGANSQTPVTGLKAMDSADKVKELMEEYYEFEKFYNKQPSEENYNSLLFFNSKLIQYILDQSQLATGPAVSTLQQNDKIYKEFLESLRPCYTALDIPHERLNKLSKPVFS